MSMELRAHAVDRVLEALSPSLAAEIERIVAETRQALEAEFQKRLEEAVRSSEASTQKTVEAQIEHAVSDAREAVRQEVTAELQAQFKKNLDAEREQLLQETREWRTFAEAQPQLAEASSQAEILARFLKLTEPFAASIAIYVAKPDGLGLWKSRGQTAFPQIISPQTADPDSYFKTIIIREKAVAAVCASRPYRADALHFLCAQMERVVEMFGLKLRAPVLRPPEPSQSALAQATVETADQSTPSGDDQQLHSEARKTARLLISEIKLYHEHEVREGRANSDLYQRLRTEIDRGRQTYNERVPASLGASRDYFHEELVRILTENDPSRLGEAYPGPKALANSG